MSASILQTEQGPSIGYIVEYPDARFYAFSEEHGHVDISACPKKPVIASACRCCRASMPLRERTQRIGLLAQGRVEAVWPIYARGKIR